MESMFCIGVCRNGILYEGMTAKALYRECPKYDHAWYADQADWIVTQIELQGQPASARFLAAFRGTQFRELRQRLSRLAHTGTEVVGSVLTAHDGDTELSIRITPDQGVLEVAFVLMRRWPQVELRFGTLRSYDDLPEIMRGLDEIDGSFPAVGDGGERGTGTCQDSRTRDPLLQQLTRALKRLARFFTRAAASRPPMELYMEYEGRCVAKLTDGQFGDMFWTTFAITPLTQDATMLQLLGSQEWWLRFEGDKIRYRFVDDGQIAFHTFPGTEGVVGGRVSLRTSGLMH
jgi:hypothetical protein